MAAAIERFEGLIVRLHPLTDTSLVVHWLAAEPGRLATVAKGARQWRSPFRGRLDLFHLCDFSFQRSRRSDLHTLREAVLRESYPSLRQQWLNLELAAHAAAMIERTCEAETPLPGPFELLRGLLRVLTSEPPSAALMFAFELKLLSDLGLLPDPQTQPLSPGARQLALQWSSEPWERAMRIQPSRAQREEIDDWLRRLWLGSCDRLPQGRAGLLACLAC